MSEDLPPYLALPKELRARIKTRLEESHLVDHLSKDQALSQKQAIRDLANLAAFRLVDYFDGDIDAAIAFANSHSPDHYPSNEIGHSKKAWKSALAKVQTELARRLADPIALAQINAFKEEIALWELQHGPIQY